MEHEPKPILGRYRFLRRLPAVARAVVWLAQDQESGREVVASLLPASRATGLEPIAGMSHPHMAQILEVIDDWDPSEVPDGEAPHRDAAVVLAEHVLGGSLHQRLQSGRVAPIKAAQWAERVADVLGEIHRMGGVHGAMSPRSVLVAQTSSGVVPMVTHLVVPPAGAFCSPDRVTGGGPSEADDVWALAATLYTALAGHPPFLGSNRKELARSIVRAELPPLDDVDPELAAIVLRGLQRSMGSRLHDAVELQAALHDWLRAQDAAARERVETDMPGAPSDRPSIADDQALQDAVVRPESREASLPVSVPPAPPPKAPPPKAPPEPLVAQAAPSPEAPEREPARQQAAAPSPTDDAASERLARLPTGASSNAVPSPLEAPILNPAEPRAGKTPSSAAAKAIVFLAAVALIGAFYFLWQRPGVLSPQVEGTATSATPFATSAAPAAMTESTARPAAATANAATASTATDSTATPTELDASAPPAADAAAKSAEPASSALPPPAASPTECMTAALPEGTFGTRPSLDFVCKQADLWGSARRLSALVNRRGRGDGVREWAELGRYELATVAVLRARCCPDAEPLTAATVRTSCTPLLTDVLRDVAATPSDENIQRFEETFQCLALRQVRYPRSWNRVPPAQSRARFDVLRERLRLR